MPISVVLMSATLVVFKTYSVHTRLRAVSEVCLYFWCVQYDVS